MFYFKFFIRDFEADTKGLSLRQLGAYLKLLLLAYHTEHPLTPNRKRLYELLQVRSRSDRDAVEWCLNEFFSETEIGFVQRRVQREIEGYRKLAERNRANGNRGGRPSKAETQSVMEVAEFVPVTGTADDDFGNPVGSAADGRQEPAGFSAHRVNGHPAGNPVGSIWETQKKANLLTDYKNIGQDLAESGPRTSEKRLAGNGRFSGDADDQADAGATP